MSQPIAGWRALSQGERDAVYALLRAAGAAAFGRGQREAGRAVASALAVLMHHDPTTDSAAGHDPSS